ncbi:hypothetical protein [Methylobacterium terrae]|uniref:hypothetical protein n=1 Tax=Methylobacterium terrae TaxID=2202827 RepID=UPI0013A55017|nr:hypothetical protein [Methylobacterium terrae]
MKKILLSVLVLGLLGSHGVLAQEGCKSVTASCSQMQANCEEKCGTAANPGRCATTICAAAMPRCKESGVWNPRTSATCWKTSNRS